MTAAAPVTAVALVGLPGVGKSTIGRRLARMLGRTFVDTDRHIEERLGCTIAELFEREGEARFRALESETLMETVERSRRGEPLVIATGGGIVLQPANRELLSGATVPVYLRASPAYLLPRLARNTRRPLLRGDLPERLERLHAERDPLYADVARFVVPAEGSSAARTAERIVGLLEPRPE